MLLALAASAVPAGGTVGTLDPSFDGDGRVETDLSTDHDLALGVAVQPDGKVVAVGRTGGRGGRAFIVRYTAQGALDPSFSDDGRVVINFTSAEDLATDVVVEADGDIAVSISAGGAQLVGMVRLLTDGTFDPSFNGDGKVTTDLLPGFEYADALMVDNIGRYYLAGGVDGRGGRMAAFGYLADGQLNTFAFPRGYLGVNLSPGYDLATAIGYRPRTVTTWPGWWGGDDAGRIAVVRFDLVGGSLDTGFGGTGKVVVDVTAGYDDVTDLAMVGRRIVVVGEASGRIGLPRLDNDGTLDPGFGNRGIVITDLPGRAEFAQGVVAEPGGAVVVAGRMSGSGGRMFVARYGFDGVLDPGFGNAGITAIDFTPSWDIAADVALGPDGIVAAGSADSDSRVAVARLLTS